MKLGKTIVECRIKKNLSQGDLAELLDVSRQSVSKWENDLAVPDLDKIVKLCEIFELSIDEFIKGEPSVSDSSQIEKIVYVTKKEKRKTVGIILLCMAAFLFVLLFLFVGIAALIFVSPFIICGIICLTVKRYTGLWCSWALYFLFDLWLRFATGINVFMVFHSISYMTESNPIRLIIAWIVLLVTILLVYITIKAYAKDPIEISEKNKKKLIIGWALCLILFVAAHYINKWLILGYSPFIGIGSRIMYLFVSVP